MPSAADIVIRDALIADGSGGPLAGGGGAIGEGMIMTAGSGPAPAGPSTVDLDARGELVCSPGFIDVHTHDDAELIRHPGPEFKIAQGCTSLNIGTAGSAVSRRRRRRHRVGMLTIGREEPRAATAAEMTVMRAHVERAMEQGACRLSTGLIYQPGKWEPTEEIIEFANLLAG